MGDDRYRIKADQLDDYAGHPEGVDLTTEHDVTPPSEGPVVVTRTTLKTGLTHREMLVTTPQARERSPLPILTYRGIATAVFVLVAAAWIWVFVRG